MLKFKCRLISKCVHMLKYDHSYGIGNAANKYYNLQCEGYPHPCSEIYLKLIQPELSVQIMGRE